MQALTRKNIVLNVDVETAELFEKKSKQDRKKLEFVFGFLLHERNETFFLRPDEKGWETLNKKLKQISDDAEAKGLTHEILEDILNEK